MTIKEEILEAFKSVEFGQIFTRSEIVEKVLLLFGRNPSSIIPSDYCYNRLNNGIDFEKSCHLFEYTEDRQYKYLGENFPYTGKIFHKPIGKPELSIGEMVNGKVFFFNTPKEIKNRVDMLS